MSCRTEGQQGEVNGGGEVHVGAGRVTVVGGVHGGSGVGGRVGLMAGVDADGADVWVPMGAERC